MPKNDLFTLSLRQELRANRLTLEAAADKAKKSHRQFLRELRGETKQGMMQIETVAELKKEGVISDNVVEAWWTVKRQQLKFKGKKKARSADRVIEKIFNLFKF